MNDEVPGILQKSQGHQSSKRRWYLYVLGHTKITFHCIKKYIFNITQTFVFYLYLIRNIISLYKYIVFSTIYHIIIELNKNIN